MCGEKKRAAELRTKTEGSPPRVRGKVGRKFVTLEVVGITPACAGKRAHLEMDVTQSKDHPRVCGEKRRIKLKPAAGEGSPPRVRGKDSPVFLLLLRCRITPACAGKRLKKAHKIKDFDPVPIRFHLVFRRFERWCSNLPTPDGNVPV